MPPRILRRNGKPVAQVVFYDSPTARLGVVVPHRSIQKLPESATLAAVRFVDKQNHRATIGRKGGPVPITLKADTVRKHLEIF